MEAQQFANCPTCFKSRPLFNMTIEMLCPQCLSRCIKGVIGEPQVPIWFVFTFDNPWQYNVLPRPIEALPNEG